jgi:hypothetical protein
MQPIGTKEQVERAVPPLFIALRPLSNELVRLEEVRVSDVLPDGTLAAVATPKSYQGVDLAGWARRFLGDMDRVLSARYAAVLDSTSAARDALDSILRTKALLARAIPAGLAPVWRSSDPETIAAVAAAAIEMEGRLEAGLLAAYDAPVLVQYDSSVLVPLRSYPPLPVLISQRATHDDTAPMLADTVRWTYAVTCAHVHAEQDEVQLTTSFNLAPTVSQERVAASDVGGELAKYTAVGDVLWALLEKNALPGSGDPLVMANAAASFATLAARVGENWRGDWHAAAAAMSPVARETGPTQQDYRFGVRLTDVAAPDGVARRGTLRLRSDQSVPGPAGLWPRVLFRAGDGTLLPLVAGTPVKSVVIYQFPQTPPVLPGEAEIALEWDGLSVFAVENARASIAVIRNQKLLGDDGPDTNDDFVYRTPVVEAATVVAPCNEWRNYDITGTGLSLETSLGAAFATLLGGATDVQITVAISYGFEMLSPTGHGQGITTRLPVAFYPAHRFDANTSDFLASAAANWLAEVKPETRGGEWIFALTVDSHIDPAAQRVLLALDDLIFRIAPPA